MAVQNGQVQAGFGFGLCLLGIFLFGEKKPLGKLLGNRSATFRQSSLQRCNVIRKYSEVYFGYISHIPTPLLVKIGYTQSIHQYYHVYHNWSPSSGRGTFRSSKLSQWKATRWPEGGNHVTFGKVLLIIWLKCKKMHNSTFRVVPSFHQDVFVASKLSILPRNSGLIGSNRPVFFATRDPVTPMRSPLRPPPWVAQRSEFVGPFDTRVCRMNSWYAFLLNLSFLVWFAIWFCFLSSFSFCVCAFWTSFCELTPQDDGYLPKQ